MTTFCQAASVSLNNAIGPLAPLLQEGFGISRTEIGLILTSVFLSGSFIALAGGRAADVLGERRVLLVSGLVGGLAALGMAGAGLFGWFLLGGFVLGIGSGIQNPAGSAAVMRWFPPRQRGLAMGLRQTGVPLGGIVAATVWPAVALTFGWRFAFVLGGVVTLIGALLIYVAYYDAARPGESSRQRPVSLRQLLTMREMWWFSLIFNGQIVAQFSSGAYFVLFLHEVLGLELVSAAAMLALVNVTAVAARVGWGSLSDRAFGGRRRPVLSAILLLTLLSTLGAAAMPADSHPALAVLLALMLGGSAFAWTGVLGTLVIESVGRDSAATAIAMVSVLGSPGTLFGPPLFGLLVDLTGSYRCSWLFTAGIVLFGLFALRRIGERATTARPVPEG